MAPLLFLSSDISFIIVLHEPPLCFVCGWLRLSAAAAGKKGGEKSNKMLF